MRRRIINPMAVAAEGAALLPAAQRATLRQNNRAALDALRRGAATHRDIARLSLALLMADTLARIAPLARANRARELQAGIDALADITRREAERGRYIATGPELGAVGDALLVHHAQVDAATVLEWETAHRKVDAHAQSKFGKKAA